MAATPAGIDDLGVRTIAGILGLACVAAAAAASAWPAPSPSRDESPSRFLVGVVRLLAANRYDEAWETLAPADQRLAPRAVYVACESRSPIPGRLASLRIRRVTRDQVGVAVSLSLVIAGSPQPGGVRVDLTAHAIPNGHSWAWILSPGRRALYRSGCGLDPGPPA